MKKTNEKNLKIILLELEEIIAKIGNYDSRNGKFSAQGRKELTAMFNEKLLLAKSLHDEEQLKLVG